MARAIAVALIFWPVALAVIVLVVPFLVIFAASAGICNYAIERRFRAQMRRVGRFITAKQVHDRISQGGGTLIIETPFIGWSVTHAWWTPEDVIKAAPFHEPSDDDYFRAGTRYLDWDHWCWENYTSPDQGRALLVRIWNGANMERILKRRLPDLQVVRTLTALIHNPNRMSELQIDTNENRFGSPKL